MLMVEESKNIIKVKNVIKEEKMEEIIEPINSSLKLIGDLVIDKQEKKTLSILKKVDGVLNYYQELKEDKEKNANPKYLYDLVMDILYLGKCQDFVNKYNVRLPIIVINQVYYDNFKEFLNDYYQYKKFKENKYLIEYLLLGSLEINNYKPFHDSHEYELVAECINTGLIKHYDFDKIHSIHNKLKEYFKSKGLKGISIDFYYDEWISVVMKIFFNFILLNFHLSVKAIHCEKCKKFAYFVDPFNIIENKFVNNQIYKDMENNETYEKSIDIANNMVNNLDFSYIALSNKDKKVKDNSLLNIIYYDEGINECRNEIVGDSFVFEKECGGALLLVTSIKSIILVLINLKRKKDKPKFHLISTGSSFESLVKNINIYKELYIYIETAVIYTSNPKYSYLKDKYSLVKAIYYKFEDVINYINKNKSTKYEKYKVPTLITYKDYNDKYIEFHKIISNQYGKLYQKSSFLTAINILEEYLESSNGNEEDFFDLKLLINNLEVFSRGSRDYKKIIKEYTNDSFYALFNKWLNQIDPLAIKKIAFFISGLQLSLNIYGIRDKKGFNRQSEIYRGALLEYSLILNYQRNVGNIIAFPSFFSTTLDINIAKEFSQYDNSKENRGGLFSVNYIIKTNPNSDWISQGFNVSGISFYKNEKEILFQPFCFFRLIKVEVNLESNICFIYMELIGKKEIWEKKMNDNSNIKYQRNGNLIELINSN